jgi:hypothetical protein
MPAPLGSGEIVDIFSEAGESIHQSIETALNIRKTSFIT